MTIIDAFALIAPGDKTALLSVRVRKGPTGKFETLYSATSHNLTVVSPTLEGVVRRWEESLSPNLAAAGKFFDEAAGLETVK